MTDAFSQTIRSIASKYATDSIVILGKGASADAVDNAFLAGSIVIGINDAERIFPADVTIFHSPWVVAALEHNHHRSSLYLAPWFFDAGQRQVIELPRADPSADSSDQMMRRLMSDGLVIEDVLFVSALQLARQIAHERGQRQRVYMVGFDFDPHAGYSRFIDVDFSPATTDAREVTISPQEHYFLHALYMLRDAPDVDVLHVGTKSYSAVTAEELNRLVRPVSVHGSEVRHEVAIVAELTTNHFGDRMRLERMIRACASSGADFVKLQKRDVSTFYSTEQLQAPYSSPFGHTFEDYRRQLELGPDDFEFVGRLCDELGIGWFASVLDRPSFDLIREHNPAMIKLPSTISGHTDYLETVSREFHGDVVVSTGMTDSTYERFILERFSTAPKLYLLQCTSAYPTPMEDCNVAVVGHYARLAADWPNVIAGYSSHDRGWLASGLAVAAGAKMVEKHVKLGDTDWAHFDAVAVDLANGDFAEYVRQVRTAELIMGSAAKAPTSSEHHKYAVSTEQRANP
jgi:sialic acid synthase SpsE